MKSKHLVLPLIFCLSLACQGSNSDNNPFTSTEQTDTTSDVSQAGGEVSGKLLSAFFGLDDGLPRSANARICSGAGNADGTPIVFSHEINSETMQAGDFRVTTAGGEVGELACVTLLPAIDPGELRTVLLVGDYGEAESDPPATVEIVGNLYSINDTVNFKGASMAVTPLESGPTLVLAENLLEDEWRLGRESTGRWGSSSGCPVEGVNQVVRVTWSGGVTTAEGEELSDLEREQYKVIVKQADGIIREVIPFALGDLEDGDNNHELCLDTSDPALFVAFPAGYLIDPNGDLNPNTKMKISPL